MEKTNISGVFKRVGKKDTTFYITYRVGEIIKKEPVGKLSEGFNADKAYEILKTRRTGDFKTKKVVKLNSFESIAKEYFELKRLDAEKEESLNKKEKQLKTLENIKKEESIFRNIFAKWNLVKHPFEQVKTHHIVKFFNEQKNTYSQKSITNAIALARSIIKHTKTSYNPFIFTEESDKKQFKINKHSNRKLFLKPEECQKLLKELEDNLRNYCIVLTQLTTGARPDSVLKLQIKDLNFDSREIRLYDFKRKMFYTARMSFQLEEKFRDLLRERTRQINEYVFINEKTNTLLSEYPNSITRIMNRLFNKDKIEDEEKIVPYTLRHTFASLLINIHKVNVFDVSKLMNHKNVQTTIDNYITFDATYVDDVLAEYSESFI